VSYQLTTHAVVTDGHVEAERLKDGRVRIYFGNNLTSSVYMSVDDAVRLRDALDGALR
jgi:hypothetical protein